MKLLKKQIVKFFNSFGYSIEPLIGKHNNYPVELDEEDVELIKYVYDAGLTMTSIPRLVNTLNSCKYVVANNIPGDFVECGVWRGGQAILAKLMFEKLGSNKSVWMFDTFTGMTAPTEPDIKAKSKVHAGEKFKKNQKENFNRWCYASLEDVKNNCIRSNLNLDGMKFVQGDVCQTLAKKQNLPEQISILRLDTDWYESTKAELEVLYPILSAKGVLIIDDYGSWEGARKAVDEYFNKNDYMPLLNVTDYTGRSAIKF